MDSKTIPCRLCGDPTDFLGTKLCGDCWELETRIQRRPDIAQKILSQMFKRDKKKESDNATT